jgi:hypothetical protein
MSENNVYVVVAAGDQWWCNCTLKLIKI